MKKVAIYGQHYEPDTKKALDTLMAVLHHQKVAITVEATYYAQIKDDLIWPGEFSLFKSYHDLDRSSDLFISMGGDGTILRAITYVQDYEIPILGINTGRLGFLATVHKEMVREAFTELFAGHYRVEQRSLIQIDIADKKVDLQGMNFALNEITVSRKNTTSMITVSTFLNDTYLTSYWADGLIIATPTGSTGYSLSCGGPVIMPTANSFVLTPIAPHNLNARPLIIPDETQIKLAVYGREEQHLVSLDSRIATVNNETEITLQKCDFVANMIQLPSEGFFKTIRNKLLWGEDKRN